MNNDNKCGFPFLYPVPKQKKAFHSNTPSCNVDPFNDEIRSWNLIKIFKASSSFVIKLNAKRESSVSARQMCEVNLMIAEAETVNKTS